MLLAGRDAISPHKYRDYLAHEADGYQPRDDPTNVWDETEQQEQCDNLAALSRRTNQLLEDLTHHTAGAEEGVAAEGTVLTPVRAAAISNASDERLRIVLSCIIVYVGPGSIAA